MVILDGIYPNGRKPVSYLYSCPSRAPIDVDTSSVLKLLPARALENNRLLDDLFHSRLVCLSVLVHGC